VLSNQIARMDASEFGFSNCIAKVRLREQVREEKLESRRRERSLQQPREGDLSGPEHAMKDHEQEFGVFHGEVLFRTVDKGFGRVEKKQKKEARGLGFKTNWWKTLRTAKPTGKTSKEGN